VPFSELKVVEVEGGLVLFYKLQVVEVVEVVEGVLLLIAEEAPQSLFASAVEQLEHESAFAAFVPSPAAFQQQLQQMLEGLSAAAAGLEAAEEPVCVAVPQTAGPATAPSSAAPPSCLVSGMVA